MNNAQARWVATLRETWDASLFYEMPEEHHHSPGVVVASVESFSNLDNDYIGLVIRLHPDGRREGITDALSASHFLADARREGRRI